jgi:DNA polymerase-1
MKYILVDGNNALYRAIFVHDNLKNRFGEFTGGSYGLLKILQGISRMGKMIVVFDGKDGATYRRKFYPEYKTNRVISDEDRRKRDVSFRQSYDLLSALGIPYTFIDGLEADDKIFSLATYYKNQGNEVTVVSGDCDFLQLIPMGIQIFQPIKKEFVDETAFMAKYGYSSRCSVLAKCLLGDHSDNIKGVDGIGEKTIAKIMQEIKEPSIENILEWARTGKTSKAKEKLANSEEILRLNARLIDLTKSGLPSDKLVERCFMKMSLIQKNKQKAKELLEYLGFVSLYGIVDEEF